MIPGQDIINFHHLGGDDIMDFISSWDLQERYSHVLKAGRANWKYPGLTEGLV